MNTTVHVDDILQMEVEALSPSTQAAFDRLVRRLRRGGIDGLPDDHVERLPSDTEDDNDDPVWRVRMGDDHRAFVVDRGEELEVINVASTKRLDKMQALNNQ